jgi:hypothetical protein
MSSEDAFIQQISDHMQQEHASAKRCGGYAPCCQARKGAAVPQVFGTVIATVGTLVDHWPAASEILQDGH